MARKKEIDHDLRVLEFKIHPNQCFQEKFYRYTYGVKKFFNFVLDHLERLDAATVYDRHSKTRVFCCKLPISYRYDTFSRQFVPCSNIVPKESASIIKDAPEVRQFTLKIGENSRDFYEAHDWRRSVLTTVSPSSMGATKGKPPRWPKGWAGGVGYARPPKVDLVRLGLNHIPLAGLLLRECNPISGILFFQRIQPSLLIKNFPTPTSQDAGILKKNSTILASNLPSSVKQAILETPYKFRSGMLNQLCTSWQEYLKSRAGKLEVPRGKPRYKPMREKVNTLIDSNPNSGPNNPRSKDACRVEGSFLVLPSFGRIKVKGLVKRFRCPGGSIPRVKVVKVLKRPSGWYIQLTASIPKARKLLKNPEGSIGISPGLKGFNFLVTDRFTVESPQYYRRNEEKMIKLQQEIDSKQMSRVILWLNHPDNSIGHAKQIFPSISQKSLVEAMQCKTIDQLAKLVSDNKLSSFAMQKIKHYNFGSRDTSVDFCFLFDKLLSESRREKDLRDRLGRLREKERLSRRAQCQKASTWLVRKHTSIFVRDGIQDLKGRAKPVVAPDNNSYESNKQALKNQLNKSLTDAAIGSVVSLIEQKSSAWGRDFKRVKPEKGVSHKRCPVCGALEDQAGNNFECSHCNYVHRDKYIIPSINLVLDAFVEKEVEWNDLSKGARQAWRLREKWQRKSVASAS
jgi:putative transposase